MGRVNPVLYAELRGSWVIWVWALGWLAGAGLLTLGAMARHGFWGASAFVLGGSLVAFCPMPAALRRNKAVTLTATSLRVGSDCVPITALSGPALGEEQLGRRVRVQAHSVFSGSRGDGCRLLGRGRVTALGQRIVGVNQRGQPTLLLVGTFH